MEASMTVVTDKEVEFHATMLVIEINRAFNEGVPPEHQEDIAYLYGHDTYWGTGVSASAAIMCDFGAESTIRLWGRESLAEAKSAGVSFEPIGYHLMGLYHA